MQRKVRGLVLLASGIVLGAFGTYLGRTTITTAALASSGGTKLAETNACTPAQNASDDGIFFVSCGGIY